MTGDKCPGSLPSLPPICCLTSDTALRLLPLVGSHNWDSVKDLVEKTAMECPSCASNNTRACWVVYEQGVRHGINWASTSPLAQRCAPPEKKTIYPESAEILLELSVLPWSVYLFFLLADCEGEGGFWIGMLKCLYPLIKITVIVAGIFFVLWLPWAWLRTKYNRDVYPQALAEHNRKWICMRCGEFFLL